MKLFSCVSGHDNHDKFNKTLFNKFKRALFENDVKSVKKILKKHKCVYKSFEFKTFPVLHIALLICNDTKDMSLLQLIVNENNNFISQYDVKSVPLLHFACFIGYKDGIEYLIEKQAPKNIATDSNNLTALNVLKICNKNTETLTECITSAINKYKINKYNKTNLLNEYLKLSDNSYTSFSYNLQNTITENINVIDYFGDYFRILFLGESLYKSKEAINDLYISIYNIALDNLRSIAQSKCELPLVSKDIVTTAVPQVSSTKDKPSIVLAKNIIQKNTAVQQVSSTKDKPSIVLTKQMYNYLRLMITDIVPLPKNHKAKKQKKSKSLEEKLKIIQEECDSVYSNTQVAVPVISTGDTELDDILNKNNVSSVYELVIKQILNSFPRSEALYYLNSKV